MQKRLLIASLLLAFAACGEVRPIDDVDPCIDNICECEIDNDCGTRAVCDTSGPGRLCACIAAYADDGNGCEFAQAPADPGFADATAWTGTRSAGVNPLAAGSVDGGEGHFNSSAVCNLGTLSQIFDMPSREDSEQFMVEVSYAQMSSDQSDRVFPAVSIGGGWHELPFKGVFGAESFCLGDAGYDGPVEFLVTPGIKSEQCAGAPTTSLSIDRLSLTPAPDGACPDPGTAFNGSFEGDTGWTFVTTGDGTAAFTGGVGEGNSRAAQLTTATRCSSGEVTGTISIPGEVNTPNAAIEFFTSGTSNTQFDMFLGGRLVTTFERGGTKRRVCVPDWAKGTVQEIKFALSRLHSTGDCSLAFARTLVVDSIAVVSEAACGDDVDAFDLGFENALNGSSLTSGWAVKDGAVNGDVAPATILSDAGQAHSGTRALRLEAINRCHAAVAQRQIVAPSADGANGPAVKFFHNVPNDATAKFGLRIRDRRFGKNELIVLPEGGGWQQAIACIPPEQAGRPLEIEFFTDGCTSGCGCGVFGSAVGLFDDVEITTDASCPAQ